MVGCQSRLDEVLLRLGQRSVIHFNRAANEKLTFLVVKRGSASSI
jgi:hypothetical protein